MVMTTRSMAEITDATALLWQYRHVANASVAEVAFLPGVIL